MRDLVSWNVNLGQWAGVRVRLHALFFLLAVLCLFAAKGRGASEYMLYGLFLAVLLLSVVLHELAHCLASRGVGGSPNLVVMWPLGGLAPANAPAEPAYECLVATAGPLANLSVAVVAAVGLALLGMPWPHLLSPAPPYELDGVSLRLVLRLALWVNLWLLFAMNLLPATPMDGGRALRAALWQAFGYERGSIYAAGVTQLTGVSLCAVAWWLPRDDAGFFAHAWMPLVFLGMFLVFCGMLEQRKIKEELSDNWLGVAEISLEETATDDQRRHVEAKAPSGQLNQWQDSRREEKIRRQRELEEEEDRQVDEILARLHETGMQGISAEDQALLKRVSDRYRNRQNG